MSPPLTHYLGLHPLLGISSFILSLILRHGHQTSYSKIGVLHIQGGLLLISPGRRSTGDAECEFAQFARELYLEILFVFSLNIIPTAHHVDLYHALTWPELSYVAVDPRGRVVGYILAKM